MANKRERKGEMGADIGEILPKREVRIEEISRKIVAVDAYNMLYQFLSTIRQPDGTPLKDSQGRITSHLSGIIYRVTKLLEQGILPVFVFDGTPPALKAEVLQRRKERRDAERLKWEALREISPAEALKHAKASARVDEYVVNGAKRLLSFLGIPVVQAPSEGEAQAAFIVARGDAHFVASQDYDALLFGSPSLLRNLSVSALQKDSSLPLISLEETLKSLKISREQLIDIAILTGTDYNEGVKGIGPKTALKLVRKFGGIEKLLASGKIQTAGIENYKEVREIFLAPKVTSAYELKWHPPNEEKVLEFLCEEHDFSEERVAKALKRIRKGMVEADKGANGGNADEESRSEGRGRSSSRKRKKEMLAKGQATLSEWF
ncbi:MAG: flap endonuclease-1 [Candidatus Methanospirare jalkutatii]|nr:flap endonuclease-1 [Candidatus Methanospirare jalkutatii]